jgi:NADH:ubiquinone oxidoreductase subunit F (NADH-binding)
MEYIIEKSKAYQIDHSEVDLNVLTEKQSLSGTIIAVRTKEGLVSSADICQVEMMQSLASYAASENCGYCSLGRIGTETIYNILNDISQGMDKQSGWEKLKLLQDLSQDILVGALCSFCQMAAHMVLESLNDHRDQYEAHIRLPNCLSVKDGYILLFSGTHDLEYSGGTVLFRTYQSLSQNTLRCLRVL